MPGTGLLIRAAEVDGRRQDVRVADGRVVAIAPSLARSDDELVVEADGGALLPGLHDHHIHLLAMAAARESFDLRSTRARQQAGLAGPLGRYLEGKEPGESIRCIGYDETVLGPLDRWALDELISDRPVRVQHRSGAMWVLNSSALAVMDVERASDQRGVERDAHGQPTGRLFGMDAWLRRRGESRAPDLSAVARELNSYGVTGVTDATPSDRLIDVEPLTTAVEGGLTLRVVITGSPALAKHGPSLAGPVKVVLADHSLPSLADVASWFACAHARGRAVAVHSVTIESLLLALEAWHEAGALPGDRLEHGAVVPPAQAGRLAALGVTVVTQPHFIEENGDRYLATVDPRDLPYLYPCRSLLSQGVPVGFGTDAPVGHADPWRAIAAATSRRTRSGRLLGGDERIAATEALSGFLGDWRSPGGPARRVAVGGRADLCLLRCALGEALREPAERAVALTIFDGRPVWRRE